MNEFGERAATEEDESFILELQKSKLSSYHLHEKKKDKFRVRDMGDEKYKEEYTPLDVSEVEIEPVRIVILDGKRVGAYKLFHWENEIFFRLYWIASTGEYNGVGSYAINQARKHATEKGINKIKLSVHCSNHKALKCYKTAGFQYESPCKKEYQECEMILTI